MPDATTASQEVVLPERTRFKVLLAQNLNYFGNLAQNTRTRAVEKDLVGDTSFEELTCVGLNPQTSFLEATIAIKRSTGYNGELCQIGEHRVRTILCGLWK